MTPVLLLGAAALMLTNAVAAAQPWPEQVVTDAQAIHDVLLDSHPGVYNTSDPGFVGQLEAGLVEARERARQVSDFAGYAAALQGYIARFDDGHVTLQLTDGAPDTQRYWPRFLTGYQAGRHMVMSRDDQDGVPGLGTELVSCDGVAADVLAQAQVGQFTGRWFLSATRARRAGMLFLDDGNPFRARSRECVFRVGGVLQNQILSWVAISAGEAKQRLDQTGPHTREPIAKRSFGERGVWLVLSSFDIYPPNSSYAALTVLLDGMRTAGPAAIRAAVPVVLDLRGNTGGSSHWSKRLADIIWGPGCAETVDLAVEAIDWRTSQANIAHFAQVLTMLKVQAEPDRALISELEAIVNGMSAARGRGEKLWRLPVGPPAAAQSPAQANRAGGQAPLIYVLTDAMCASACLDAVDLWKALGAIQVGQETSADTLYMDVRTVALPAGHASIHVPTKVYRGRQRGSNEPQKPLHYYPSDMNDTRALKTWILSLPESLAAGKGRSR